MSDMIVTSAEAMEAEALPKRHEAHCKPQNKAGEMPSTVTHKPVAQKSPAEWAHERLILYIQNFEGFIAGHFNIHGLGLDGCVVSRICLAAVRD